MDLEPIQLTEPVRPAHVARRRLPFVEFLIALTVLLVADPFLEHFSDGELIESLLLTIVLVSAVFATGARGRTLLMAIVLVAPALVGKWFSHFRPDLVSPVFFLVPAVVFLAFVVAQFMSFILRAPRVNAQVVSAGLGAYLLLGLLWSLAYALVAQLVPNAFAFNGAPISNPPLRGFTAIYFSYITLTTVGYGDITPVAGAARMLAAWEGITGTLFLAVLIARLVSLYSSEKPGNPGVKPPET